MNYIHHSRCSLTISPPHYSHWGERNIEKYEDSDKDSHESSQYLHEFPALILLVWKNKFD